MCIVSLCLIEARQRFPFVESMDRCQKTFLSLHYGLPAVLGILHACVDDLALW
jgi:hypothetical protein